MIPTDWDIYYIKDIEVKSKLDAKEDDQQILPRIFLSYRRQDEPSLCDRIYANLSNEFGMENVIRDVNDIPLGVDFREYIKKLLSHCNVELVLVGSKWLNLVDELTNERRLDNPADLVRIEIEVALTQNMIVVPIALVDAQLPTVDKLPESLKALAFRNGTHIRNDPDFVGDMYRLIQGIRNRFEV